MRLQFSSIAFAALAAAANPIVSSVKIGTSTYEYNGLAGYGFVPFSEKDSRGDTIGGIGSSAAIEKKSWKKTGKTTYQGTLWGLPDRGFNVLGTINYQSRVHKFTVTLDTSISGVNKTNVQFKYQESIFFTDPKGTPLTGLDADAKGPYLTFSGLPEVPSVHYTGDGFGNNGTGGTRVVLDSEGIVLNDDGSFWISDEYGPYVYKFDSKGTLIQAIRPPNTFLPLRNGSVSFSADSPPIYDPKNDPVPANPTAGRQNNQGFEGLSTSPDGTKLYVLLQSALRQDGGQGGSSNRFYTRFLIYDSSSLKVLEEYVVKLPVDSSKAVDAQSEVHYLSDKHFLVLARDSNRGSGLSVTESLYRQADIFDISNATNIVGQYDAVNSTIVTNVTTAALKPGIVPVTYYPFINYNNNTELAKFGLHNGGAQDFLLLNEKWESFALLPVSDDSQYHKRGDNGKDYWSGGYGGQHGYSGGADDGGDEYFLFSLSDNDFRAKDGTYSYFSHIQRFAKVYCSLRQQRKDHLSRYC
jgi:hypothetical protein